MNAFLIAALLAAAPQFKEGELVEGVVGSVADYGCFVTVRGIDGLLHIADLSWGPIHSAAERCTRGEKLKVKVLRWNPDTQRLSLGLKQTVPDPWDSVAAKYPTGKKVKGQVLAILEYGLAVGVEPGIEGLLHVSETGGLGDVKRGQAIEVVVAEVDVQKKMLLFTRSGPKLAVPSRSLDAERDDARELIANLRPSLLILRAFAEAKRSDPQEVELAKKLAARLEERVRGALGAAKKSESLGKVLLAAASSVKVGTEWKSVAQVKAAQAALETLATELERLEPVK